MRRAVLILLLLTGCFERTKPSVESNVRPVQAVRVALAPASAGGSYAGTIRPRREADLAFRAPGRIASRVDLGSRVRAGDMLARLDPADLALAVRSAAADLAAAEAVAEQARADAGRSRTLHGQGWVASGADEIRQSSARSAAQRVASAQAALELARNRLGYAELRAPSDGVVTAIVADPGTVVAEGAPVLRFAEGGGLEADVALPEDVVGGLVAGAGAQVTIWAGPQGAAPLPATLREVSAASGAMRTFGARFALDAPPPWLAIGMTATVRLSGAGAAAKVASVPQAALADRGSGAIVWVVQADGALEPRPVQVRAVRDGRAEVTGLADGEMVVSLGVQKLDPAARVRVAQVRP